MTRTCRSEQAGTRVVEARSGAQALPDVGDPQATVSAWAAHSATSADLRRKSPAHADLAARLIIVADIDPAVLPGHDDWKKD